MTWLADPLNRLLIILAVALLVGAVGCWVIFRDPVDDEDEADFDADLDDYEDDDDETLLDVRPADLAPVYADTGAALEPAGSDHPGADTPWPDALRDGPAGALVLHHGDRRGPAGADWRASMIVQLAPAALAAENLPGPARAPRERDNGRAGELHYMDGWLGTPGDGSGNTFLRVRREQERMMARYEREQAAWCAKYGVVHVPVWRAAA